MESLSLREMEDEARRRLDPAVPVAVLHGDEHDLVLARRPVLPMRQRQALLALQRREICVWCVTERTKPKLPQVRCLALLHRPDLHGLDLGSRRAFALLAVSSTLPISPGIPHNVYRKRYRADAIDVDLSDESLLAGMALGDPDAAAAFVHRYQARVYGLALTIVGSTAVAEEVAQEAFLRVWRNGAAYDARRGRVATWVLTITRNLAIDTVRLRGEQPIDPHALMGTLLPHEEGGSRSAHLDDKEHLRRAVRALPPEQSRLIVLSVFYGLTARETADLEGIPLGTAKTRIRRGLAKLRETLGVSGG